MRDRFNYYVSPESDKPATFGDNVRTWIAYGIGITAILTALGSFIAAVWTGEWRYLLVTVFVLWLINGK